MSDGTSPDLDLLADAVAKRVVQALEPILARLKSESAVTGSQSLNARIEVGPLFVDCERQEAFVRGKRLNLRPREFALLAALARQPGRVFTRAQLLDIAWPQDAMHCTDRTIDTHVARVRRSLERDADCIRTVIGSGYKLDNGTIA